jgi:hypothetical protein
MREEEADLGGTRILLETADDLLRMDRKIAKLVPSRVRALFADYPRSILALADATTFAPLARWLRHAAATRRAEIGIYVPAPQYASRMKPEVYLELVAPSASTDTDDRVLLSGGFDRVPEWCPPSLREVLEHVGVVRTQYNCAGNLLGPTEQISLSELYEEMREMWFPEGEDGIEVLPDAAEYHAFLLHYTGAHYVTNAVGRTKLCPSVGGHREGPPIDMFLSAFFDDGPEDCGDSAIQRD